MTACGISYSEVRSDVQKVAGGKFLCVGDRRKDAAGGGERILIGLCEVVVCVRWFEVCRTSKLPAKETFLRSFCVVQKEPKSTPEVCEPLDSGDDSKLCRKRFCKAFRRHVSKPVLSAKRRRKGFESVRKGYRSADARLMFFEKGLLYCKLTVGCRG